MDLKPPRNRKVNKCTFDVPPITNHRLIPVNGRLVKNKANRNYFDYVKAECVDQSIIPFDGDVFFCIKWYRKTKSGDVPDRWKSLCDALQAKTNYGFGFYEDDKQIKAFFVERFDNDKKNSRIEVLCWSYSD